MKRLQTTDTILMVRPAKFGFNEETAQNNYFQKKEEGDEVAIKALKEFDDYVELLRSNGVRVVIVQDTPPNPTPRTPYFPTIGSVPIVQASWFSTPCLLKTDSWNANTKR